MAKLPANAKKLNKELLDAKKQRTQEDILGAQLDMTECGQTVTMGEKKYILMPKKGLFFSRKFRTKVQPILEDVSSISNVISSLMIDQKVDLKSLTDENFTTVARLLTTVMGDKFYELLDLVYWWSPEIKKDREILEGSEDVEGTASELDYILALITIAKFVYGPLISTLQMHNIQEQAKVENNTE